MKHWNYFDFSRPDRKIYKIRSDGCLMRVLDSEKVSLSFEEVRNALSPDPELGYERIDELFKQKHPQDERDQKELSKEEQSELERTVFS